MKNILWVCLFMIMPLGFVQADVIIGDQTTDNSNTAQANSDGLFYNYSGGHVTQNFEASKQIPYMPGTPSVSTTPPTLFSQKGLPAQVAGMPTLYKNTFAPQYHDVTIGKSRGTKIIFNGKRLPKQDKKDRNIYFDFNGVARGEIVGSVTIQARKNKGDEVDLTTLVYDATNYIKDVRELKGYDLTLLTISKTITYSMGVDGGGSGFSASPVGSGLTNGATGLLLGLATGFSKSGGVTVPTALVGCTFLVVADTGTNRVVNLTPNGDELEANGNGNSTKRKKYEAVK